MNQKCLGPPTNGFGHIWWTQILQPTFFIPFSEVHHFEPQLANLITMTAQIKVPVFPIQKWAKWPRRSTFAKTSTLNHYQFQWFKYREWTTPSAALYIIINIIDFILKSVIPQLVSMRLKKKRDLCLENPPFFCSGHFNFHNGPSQATWKRNHESGSLLVGILPAWDKVNM